MTRAVSLLLAVMVLFLFLVPGVRAEETTEAAEVTEETEAAEPAPASGACGEDMTWEIQGNTLVITGTGKMEDGSPWQGSAWKIGTVILEGEITYIGAEAFAEFEKLTGVDFGGSLKEIGEGAFRGCTSLEEISLPDTFRKFGVNALAECLSLERVYCSGPMPSFKGGCLRDCGSVTIYYPGSNPWPREEIDRLSDSYGGRLEILQMDSETPAPTEVKRQKPAATEATEAPEETEAPTVPVTVATVPPPSLPEPTQAPAQPAAETTEPAQTVVYTLPTMATEPVETAPREPDGLGGGIIGMVLVAGVLTFFIAGALIARSARNRGGKYSR